MSNDWNLVVTSQQGTLHRLRDALSPLVRLRRSGFRSVLVGRVEDPEAFLVAMAELLAARPKLHGWLGKVIPVERTFPIDPATFQARLVEEAAAFVERLRERRFHVRVERRGHKGVIATQECERALGASLWTALEARGARPVVDFRDPDVVLAVELVGDTAGLGLVTRETRERFPFVRID